MKYEQQLKKRMIPSWHLYYMAYSQLKQLLKQKSDHWLIQDEEEFENILGSELSKVCRFLRHQLDRISEQTHQLEKECQQQRQRQRQQQQQQQQQQKTSPTVNNDGDPLVVADDGYASQVTELIFELHDTAQFLQANKTAFDKMVKKHDRYTSFSIRQRYNHLMTTSSFDTYTQQLDSLLIRLCYLYDLYRLPRQQASDTAPPSSHIINDRTKQHEQKQQKSYCTTFWIHPDNINEVKAICLFHLSMLPSVYPYNTHQPTTTTYQQQEDKKDRSNRITSIYLDNGNFDLYKKQLERCNDYNATLLGENAAPADDWNSNKMVRCRWYGHDSSTMHLERQQSHGTGHQQRCMIDGVTEASYLDSHYGKCNTIVNVSSTSRHLGNTYHQIQQSIRQQHLEPKCRTTCQRITFQQKPQHGLTHLRIDIDTNIKLSKIAKGINDTKTSKNHQGAGVDDNNKIHAFPYGLLTVHHYHGGTNRMTPCTVNWLVQLLSSHLVYPVPRFSTFVHAISLLYGDQLALSFLSPWWILSVPKDIRKPPCNSTGLSRSTTSARPLINGHRQTSFEHSVAVTEAEGQEETYSSSGEHIVIPLTHATTLDDDHDTNESSATPCWWQLRRRRRCQQQQQQYDYHQRLESNDDSLFMDDGYHPTITELSSTTIISKGKKKADTTTTTTSGISKGKKKDIVLDYNVKNNRMTEPKTYFANERTFISWLQFCAVLLTVALSLFNHGDWISRWMGAMFLCMTCLLTFYALGRFQYRSWQLRTRRYVLRYDDVFGPTVLCFFLVIAMILNIYLRLPLFEI